MCKYVTHRHVCLVCRHEDTVLISERPCSFARQSGVFGSCGRGIGNTTKSTPQHCWKCRDLSHTVSQSRYIQPVCFI